MDPLNEAQLLVNRRHFFGKLSTGIGAAALGSLLNPALFAADANAGGAKPNGSMKAFHFAPKAKRVIYLFMAGGPSQIDLYDHKPLLEKYHQSELPESVRNGQRITTMTSGQKSFPVAKSMFQFKQYGKSGAWFSELVPNIATLADDLCVIKTVNTEAINHDPAMTFIGTGFQQPGRPSRASRNCRAWTTVEGGSKMRGLVTIRRKPCMTGSERANGSGPLASSLSHCAYRVWATDSARCA